MVTRPDGGGAVPASAEASWMFDLLGRSRSSLKAVGGMKGMMRITKSVLALAYSSPAIVLGLIVRMGFSTSSLGGAE
jgi:hypothetical protein